MRGKIASTYIYKSHVKKTNSCSGHKILMNWNLCCLLFVDMFNFLLAMLTFPNVLEVNSLFTSSKLTINYMVHPSTSWTPMNLKNPYGSWFIFQNPQYRDGYDLWVYLSILKMDMDITMHQPLLQPAQHHAEKGQLW